MAKSESPAVLRDVQTLFSLGTIHGLTDAQLLDRFQSGTDPGSEAAFAGLVARHGSMVWGVCRRTLNNPHDIADAFQATFLILVRKAETVQARDSLGRWLYGVSRRVAVRAKRAADRRSAREVEGVESLACLAPRTPDNDLPVILDEEIGRLPAKYRAAVVLCDLEGLGQEEAARQLGCAVGTVKSRLSRGREKLRSRLIRRGVAPSIVAWRGNSVIDEIPAATAEATVKAATQFAAGQVEAAGLLSARVIDLTQGVLSAMLFTKLRYLFVTVTTITALTTGAVVLARQATTSQPQEKQAADREVSEAKQLDAQPGTVRTAPPASDPPNDKDEEKIDRIDALQLDIEILTNQLSTLRQVITQQSSSSINTRHYRIRLGGNMQGPGGRATTESLEEVLKEERKNSLRAREDYLEMSRELRQKQRELARLIAQQRDNPGMPGLLPPGSLGILPSTPHQAKAAPALEQRVSEVEQKLDEILKLLKELKQ
ncbi:RNA polymerase sigma factor [Singulisphaera sp. Ch08]|uniref:RNA polymerase sigma factor n=1 Tax=Singulisphaera sp. Ch08 TaxID=3120278 RepID=A0AAU7CIG3_9BACT